MDVSLRKQVPTEFRKLYGYEKCILYAAAMVCREPENSIFSVHVRCMSSPVRPSVGLSVTFVCPTQQCFYIRRLVLWPSVDIQVKCYADRPRGNPPSGELYTRVAEYSDFGSIERYIPETVQDRRYVSINH